MLVLGVGGYLIWNNIAISKITLEINPSIEIRLNRNNKVVRVVPLNDDAKEIVKGNSMGKDMTRIKNHVLISLHIRKLVVIIFVLTIIH